METVALVRDPLYLKHSNGPLHPEAPARLLAIDDMLAVFPLQDQLEDIPARDATFEELAWVHEERYIRQIEKTRESSFTILDPDTSAGADSYAAALRAPSAARSKRRQRSWTDATGLPLPWFVLPDTMPKRIGPKASACSTTSPWRPALPCTGTA